MGLVDVEPRAGGAAAYVGEAGEVGAVAVHAVYALGDDEYVGVSRGFALEDALEMVVVGVAEALEVGAAQAYAVDDAGVHEAVGHDEGGAVGEGAYQADVGMVSAVEEQRAATAAVALGQETLQRGKGALTPGQQARCRGGHQQRGGGMVGQEALAQGDVVGQAEIVVARQVDDAGGRVGLGDRAQVAGRGYVGECTVDIHRSHTSSTSAWHR